VKFEASMVSSASVHIYSILALSQAFYEEKSRMGPHQTERPPICKLLSLMSELSFSPNGFVTKVGEGMDQESGFAVFDVAVAVYLPYAALLRCPGGGRGRNCQRWSLYLSLSLSLIERSPIRR
jgi:hypothetical protein